MKKVICDHHKTCHCANVCPHGYIHKEQKHCKEEFCPRLNDYVTCVLKEKKPTKEDRLKNIWNDAKIAFDDDSYNHFHDWLCRVYGIIEFNANQLTSKTIESIRQALKTELYLAEQRRQSHDDTKTKEEI